MWSDDYNRITRKNRGLFTQLFLSGSCPESGYTLGADPHTHPHTYPRELVPAIKSLYPQAQTWGLWGRHSTVVVEVLTENLHLWIMRNAHNRGSNNLVIFDALTKRYYFRTSREQIVELLQILYGDRNQLPLLIGTVHKSNQRVFEERLKGGCDA